MPCARWCRAQVDFEPETFIIYIPAFNRRQHPQSHADLALSANRAHALSLNASNRCLGCEALRFTLRFWLYPAITQTVGL